MRLRRDGLPLGLVLCAMSMDKRIQAKHLSEREILEFMDRDGGPHTHFVLPVEKRDEYIRERRRGGGGPNWYLIDAFPNRGEGIPERVLLAKLVAMKRRGLIDGCGCGCRGDWELTSKGVRVLREMRQADLEAARPKLSP